MRFHRLPGAREYMGQFWLPPLPGRDEEEEAAADGKRHAKRDTGTGRFKKLTKKERQKAKARARAKEMLERGHAVPGRLTCYSATCADCGRTYLSAVRPIKLNAERDGRRVYLCGRCRELLP